MKNLIIALILGSALPVMNANAAGNNPDQAESDAAYALFETYTVKASAADVDGLPAKFKCGDMEVTISKLFGAHGILASTEATGELAFDLSDGDQVEELRIKRADLMALADQHTRQIDALEISGYWWADGDHVKAGSVKCEL
jgi:hypothetical protein